jgi:hypothetical protein
MAMRGANNGGGWNEPNGGGGGGGGGYRGYRGERAPPRWAQGYYAPPDLGNGAAAAAAAAAAAGGGGGGFREPRRENPNPNTIYRHPEPLEVRRGSLQCGPRKTDSACRVLCSRRPGTCDLTRHWACRWAVVGSSPSAATTKPAGMGTLAARHRRRTASEQRATADGGSHMASEATGTRRCEERATRGGGSRCVVMRATGRRRWEVRR